MLKSSGKELTVEEFRKLVKNIVADDTSFRICVVFLLHHHHCYIDANQRTGQELVRVSSAEEEVRHGATGQRSVTGQQLDMDVASFEGRGRKFDEEIDKIEEEMKKNREAAQKLMEDHDERRAERLIHANFDLQSKQDQLSVASAEQREIRRTITTARINAEREEMYRNGTKILSSVSGDEDTGKNMNSAKLELRRRMDNCQQSQQLLSQTSNIAASKQEEDYIKSEMARMKARPRPPTSGNTDGQTKTDLKDDGRDKTKNGSQGSRKDKKNNQNKAQDGKSGSHQQKASNGKDDGPQMMEH
jgi:hypothetical protein